MTGEASRFSCAGPLLELLRRAEISALESAQPLPARRPGSTILHTLVHFSTQQLTPAGQQAGAMEL
jgi:hypothetical protein